MAKPYQELRARGLVGISDRVIADHLGLYEKAVEDLAELDATRPQSTWRMPADLALVPGQAWELLGTPINQLDLAIGGLLVQAIEQVFHELKMVGIAWRPNIVVGDADFWTEDQATTINVPWTLANPVLWSLVNDQTDRYTYEDVVRILRHEVGHAIGYAFELWRDAYWQTTFGDFFAPYRDDYAADPESRDFVLHLHRLGLGLEHYAQKHPDEDWAETFAVWIDPGSRWRENYANWPGALRKLQTVDDLIIQQGRASGIPQNRRTGRPEGVRKLTKTVREVLGFWSGPGMTGANLRRTSALRNSIALHESYFDTLVRGAGDAGPSAELQAMFANHRYGSFDAWAADFRACIQAADGWAVAAWDQYGVRNFVVDGHDRGLPAGMPILLAVDCWEHAYAGDVGAARWLYAGAIWRNISWAIVEMRARIGQAAAVGGLAALQPTIAVPLPTQPFAPTPAPQPWGVLYAAPNLGGGRKACRNCALFDGKNACGIHAVPVTDDMICGYHVEGAPSDGALHLNVVPVDPATSGLDTVPGGTSCGGCRHYRAFADTGRGECQAVSTEAEVFRPAPVAALGCCARWSAPPAPVALVIA